MLNFVKDFSASIDMMLFLPLILFMMLYYIYWSMLKEYNMMFLYINKALLKID
jgi:hypothetical protein